MLETELYIQPSGNKNYPLGLGWALIGTGKGLVNLRQRFPLQASRFEVYTSNSIVGVRISDKADSSEDALNVDVIKAEFFNPPGIKNYPSGLPSTMEGCKLF